MKKYKPVKILCPQCNSHIGTWDGRSTTNYIARCSKCRKRVIYHVDSGEIELKPLPERTCGSGLTFS